MRTRRGACSGACFPTGTSSSTTRPGITSRCRPSSAGSRSTSPSRARMRFLSFARGLSLVLTALSVGLLFLVGRLGANRRVGLLAGLFLVAQPVVIQKTLEIRPDVPALPFFLGGLWFLLRGLQKQDEDPPARTLGWFLGGGLCLGAAIMCTQKMLFVLPGAFAGLGLWALAGGRRTLLRRIGAVLMVLVGIAVPVASRGLPSPFRGAAINSSTTTSSSIPNGGCVRIDTCWSRSKPAGPCWSCAAGGRVRRHSSLLPSEATSIRRDAAALHAGRPHRRNCGRARGVQAVLPDAAADRVCVRREGPPLDRGDGAGTRSPAALRRRDRPDPDLAGRRADEILCPPRRPTDGETALRVRAHRAGGHGAGRLDGNPGVSSASALLRIHARRVAGHAHASRTRMRTWVPWRAGGCGRRSSRWTTSWLPSARVC